MSEYMLDVIKSQDLFGYKIELIFIKKGSQHSTWLGGCASILIKLFMIFYIGFLSTKLVKFQNDKIETTVTA